MWPFRKKVTGRRLEVRRNIPQQRKSLWRRFAQAGGPGSVAVAAGFFLAVAALLIWPAEPSPYRLGQRLGTVYARVAFDSPDLARTAEERQAAALRTPATYAPNETLFRDIEAALLGLPDKLQGITEREKVPAEVLGPFRIESDADLTNLLRYTQGEALPAWRAEVAAVMKNLAGVAILTGQAVQREQQRTSTAIRLHLPGGESLARSKTKLPPEVFYLTPEYRQWVRDELAKVVHPLPAAVQGHVRAYLESIILPADIATGQPTYRLDAVRTAADTDAAMAAAPLQVQHIDQDAVIFRGGLVGPENLKLLNQEREAWLAQRDLADPHRGLRMAAGQAFMGLLITVLLGAYLLKYQPRVVRNQSRGLALAALLVLMLGVVKALVVGGDLSPYWAVGAATMGAIIVTIAYDQRMGLAVGMILSLLLTVELRLYVGFFMSLATAQMVCVFCLREIRTRSKLIEVGGLAAVAALAAAAMTEMARAGLWDRSVIVGGLWAALSVLAAGFLIQGILPLIERVFGIATSMTLLELCDANNKLLRRLAMEAPGTYNHSLLLGTLCEAAADAIGARGLLARAGAYYHDIGKINKPEYFVENQLGSPSKHAKLSPAMSLLIITGHVKDGLEMAREYGLPRVLHEFIASHHGTTLVQYFYHAATEQHRAGSTDRPPEEIEYRYAGPRPRSKEAAILMLADATESSVRAMSEPTAARIESQAHAIVSARLMDGQLDECDLTLREVHEIEASLVKSLCALHHGRIAYPKTEPKEEPRPGRMTGA